MVRAGQQQQMKLYAQKDTTSGRLGVRANLQRERFPRSAKDKWLLRALNN